METGFNVLLMVVLDNNCSNIGCSKDLNTDYPPEMNVLEKWAGVACMNPCDKQNLYKRFFFFLLHRGPDSKDVHPNALTQILK